MNSKFAAALLTVLVFPHFAEARPARDWKYDELFAESDIVAIFTATSIKEVKNTDGFFPSRLVQQIATLKVKSLFKGKNKSQDIEFVYFRQKTQREVGKSLIVGIVNGPTFIRLQTRVKVIGLQRAHLVESLRPCEVQGRGI